MLDNLRPSLVVPSVIHITPETIRGLCHADYYGVGFDFDKTLLDQHAETIPPEHLDVLAKLGEAGMKLAIGSNAPSQERTNRVEEIISHASDQIEHDITVVTSRMVGGARKPSTRIFNHITGVISVPNTNMVFVGDQLLKDVLGANRAGYGGTILVAPYGEVDHPGVKLIQRPLEVLLRPIVGAPLLTKNFHE